MTSALLAVTKLLNTIIELFLYRSLVRILRKVLLHLAVQFLVNMLVGSPFRPWNSISGPPNRHVSIELTKKLCVLTVLTRAKLVLMQWRVKSLTIRCRVAGDRNSGATL